MPQVGVYGKAEIEALIAAYAALAPPPTDAEAEARAEAKVAAHAALTTGIHGVGSLHIAGFHSAGQALSKVIWLDASDHVFSDSNITGIQSWDADLTEWVGANGKFALLRLGMRADTVGTGDHCHISVRKNGTDPLDPPTLTLDKVGTTVDTWHYSFVIVALDNKKKIENELYVGTGWQADVDIAILGYIE